MLRKAAAVGGASLAVVTCLAVSADADDGWGTVDCTQVSAPGCELAAGSEPSGGGTSSAPGGDTGEALGPGRPTGGDSAPAACTYQPSGYRPPPGAAGSGVLAPGGAWLDGFCSAQGAFVTPAFVPATTPAEVARLARQQLRLPAPTISASPHGDQLVNLPTWLWLDEGWRDVSATATIPGVTVTAVAVPKSVSWAMGDGNRVVCLGPGTPYQSGMDPRSSSPDCGHTFHRSSAGRPGEAYTVTATLHWSVSWSGAGQSGAFPDMTTVATTRLRVAEAQALGTG